MAAAYERGDCLCGGIFGTGTNGAYVESLAKITKMGHSDEDLATAKKTGLDKMVVNTECELRRSQSFQGVVLTAFLISIGGAFDNEVGRDCRAVAEELR